MFEIGRLYRYSYLWARQRDKGENTGRKDRPACLLIRNPRIPDLLFLFPVSSSSPLNEDVALAIPEAECRKAGLRPPAWLYLSEFNVASASDPFDFASVRPIGSFSEAFLAIARSRALELVIARKARLVKRT